MNIDGAEVTCGHCNHTGEFYAFTRTRLGADMPPGHFQCPKCRRAWEVVKTPITIMNGKAYSQPNKIKPAQGEL